MMRRERLLQSASRQPLRGMLRVDSLEEDGMATGWAAEGAVQEQIDATVKDGIRRAKSRIPEGPGLMHCAECGGEIPPARRAAIPGVRLCLPCQDAQDRDFAKFAGYNRRGSKDSQLR
jgi:phage/conjugal plasmid C-4 type zinc finger TraR family protein